MADVGPKSDVYVMHRHPLVLQILTTLLLRTLMLKRVMKTEAGGQ